MRVILLDYGVRVKEFHHTLSWRKWFKDLYPEREWQNFLTRMPQLKKIHRNVLKEAINVNSVELNMNYIFFNSFTTIHIKLHKLHFMDIKFLLIAYVFLDKSKYILSFIYIFLAKLLKNRHLSSGQIIVLLTLNSTVYFYPSL